MLKSVLILLVCAVSLNTMAQMDNQKLQYLKKIEKYRRVRNLGLVMVVAGTTMGIVGFSRIVNSTPTNPASDKDFLLFVAGAPFFSAGIPLTIVGHSVKRKYEKRLQKNSGVSFQLLLKPKEQGLALTYRF